MHQKDIDCIEKVQRQLPALKSIIHRSFKMPWSWLP